MSNPNRTSYNGPPLSGPGIIWASSSPKAPLDNPTFNKWYQTVHIPDIITAKPGSNDNNNNRENNPGCIGAWRFKSRNTTHPRPHLALYSIPNMSFIQAPEFTSISQHSQLLPSGGPSQKYIDFDTRFYRRTQVFTKPSDQAPSNTTTPSIGKVLKTTAIQPAAGLEQELDRWYREEHLEQVSHMPGWRKSTRFELVFKVLNKDDREKKDAPRFLAVHEFEKGAEVRRLPREEWSEWTRRLVEGAVEVDEAVWEWVWGMGEEGAGL